MCLNPKCYSKQYGFCDYCDTRCGEWYEEIDIEEAMEKIARATYILKPHELQRYTKIINNMKKVIYCE